MAEIDRIRAMQLGLVHRNQWVDVGMSIRTLERRAQQGECERVQRDVYRFVAFEETHEQQLLAATLSAGEGSAVSHRAAAAFWGVDRFECGLIEITHPFEHQLRLRDVILHRSIDLVPEDITFVGPIPVTSRPRTLIDLGAVARPWLVSRALEQWLREGHITIPQVRTALDSVARRGRSGAGVLRKILDERVLELEASDSDAEVVLAEALRAHGGPQPVFHHLINVGADTFEVDFAYPDEMLVIEVDGYGPHTDPARFEEDVRRQNLLIDEGHMVRRYSAKRVMRRSHVIAAEIERTRQSRAAPTNSVARTVRSVG
jgi:very-short-patch-repair endonuclease